ncbi:uncharacterized protein LOC109833692 isoform X2 [Asparagus officinalis]|uniref:uncharacterized protein LOC109833692 isoform X2 n=1 Tax=Asparagus officinalis TaxID=4686 RepID=UPI00098E24FD|nr:uncharacterized protein LOC109833692 isoform X2 [Asparagus officinalis]
MGVRRIALFHTRSHILNKEPFDRTIYKNMALFISSCWFYFTQFVFFLVKFTARHVFRIKHLYRNGLISKDAYRMVTSESEQHCHCSLMELKCNSKQAIGPYEVKCKLGRQRG